jgi:hypothetical protein
VAEAIDLLVDVCDRGGGRPQASRTPVSTRKSRSPGASR